MTLCAREMTLVQAWNATGTNRCEDWAFFMEKSVVVDLREGWGFPAQQHGTNSISVAHRRIIILVEWSFMVSSCSRIAPFGTSGRCCICVGHDAGLFRALAQIIIFTPDRRGITNTASEQNQITPLGISQQYKWSRDAFDGQVESSLNESVRFMAKISQILADHWPPRRIGV